VRRDVLQDRSEGVVGLSRAAWHHRRPLQGTHFATGDAASDEVEPEAAELHLSAPGVLVVGVAAVDDDVTFVEVRQQPVDHRVGALAGLHHDHDPPGPFQGGDEVLNRGRGDERALLAVVAHDQLGPRVGAVEDGDSVTVAGHVAGKAAAHHCHADDPHLSGCRRVGSRDRRRSAFDAGPGLDLPLSCLLLAGNGLFGGLHLLLGGAVALAGGLAGHHVSLR
jgi:hypothetical protein